MTKDILTSAKEQTADIQKEIDDHRSVDANMCKSDGIETLDYLFGTGK